MQTWRAMKKIIFGILAVLLGAAAIFYLTLVAATYHPDAAACTWDLDLAKVRALAASIPGDKPKEIRVEDVTGTRVPRALACPGRSWDRATFRVYSYQLVFADKTILVDSAMDRAQAKSLSMTDGFDDAAWQRVTAGLSSAAAVYVTHEHADHMGGAFVDSKWAGNIWLTPLQLDSTVGNRPVISSAARAAVRTIRYDKYQAVAPGVVLIAALGHTPGSQMVFVTRADGAEVLFAGDTAWLMDNIEHEQGPAKFVFWMTGGNRNENACQLGSLKRIQKDINVMPGHDPDRMKELLEKGVFVRGFK
jgi:glyoxylase-like metal-dependent hydrolase (beta-lactamase superfamily II)